MTKFDQKLFISIAVGFSFIATLTSWLAIKRANYVYEYVVSSSNHESCLYGAVRAREGFKGTQFENWNFYESCLLNIECANPMLYCPKQEIHEVSKFFINYKKGEL